MKRTSRRISLRSSLRARRLSSVLPGPVEGEAEPETKQRILEIVRNILLLILYRCHVARQIKWEFTSRIKAPEDRVEQRFIRDAEVPEHRRHLTDELGQHCRPLQVHTDDDRLSGCDETPDLIEFLGVLCSG